MPASPRCVAYDEAKIDSYILINILQWDHMNQYPRVDKKGKKLKINRSLNLF